MCRDLQRCRAAMGDGVKKVYESEKRPFNHVQEDCGRDVVNTCWIEPSIIDPPGTGCRLGRQTN